MRASKHRGKWLKRLFDSAVVAELKKDDPGIADLLDSLVATGGFAETARVAQAVYLTYWAIRLNEEIDQENNPQKPDR